MQYKKEIQVRYDVDAFVAGGGLSGVAAAWEVAKDGRSALMRECCQLKKTAKFCTIVQS